jgi:large subunit ribosomal protein L1
MNKHSKRLEKLKSIIKLQKYSCDDAINLIKNLSTAKFQESIEAHINLNVNPKYQNQQLKNHIIFPNTTGKKQKIAVFTNIASLQNLYCNDNDILIGTTNLLNNINNNIINFNVLLTTPDLISQLTKFGKVLGPKGLMPSLKTGTITEDLIQVINEFKQGKVEYKTDKTGIVHVNIGNIEFSQKAIKENLLALYSSIEKNKPKNIKGQFFKSVYLCTTMSPSLNLDLNSFKKF